MLGSIRLSLAPIPVTEWDDFARLFIAVRPDKVFVDRNFEPDKVEQGL